jgi:hypothetical protein
LLETASLEGTTEPDLVVHLFRGGDLLNAVGTVAADAGGYFEFPNQSLAVGSNLFTAMSSDAVGNTSQANLDVTRVQGDAVPP